MKRRCPHCDGLGELSIAQTVIKARKRNGLTQADLANAVGVARASVANIEAERQVIVPENIRKFSEVLKIPIDWLVP